MSQFRANWSKLALKAIRRLPAADRDAILARVGDVHPIVDAGVLTWLSAEHQARLFDAVHATLGPAGARGFWRDLMLLSFQRSLLRPLVEGGLRLFGPTPRSILRMSPQAYSLIARGCGSITVDDLPSRGVRLTFDELPPLLRTQGYVEMCHGNCLAVLRFLDREGHVEVDAHSLGRGDFRIDVT